jgi:hypothetical protein
VTAGLILQVILSANAKGGYFGTAWGRVFNFFCFFTVQSNIVVAVTTGMLAVRLRRSSTPFQVFRLIGLVAIVITGIVFYVALKDLHELTGWDALADFVLHTASPILTAVGWLLFGPRGRLSARIMGYAVIGPVAWLAFTLARGPFVQTVAGRDYYPYPFLDVQEHGYVPVLVNIALVAVVFLAVSAGAVGLDRHLPGVPAEAT